tara:strand:- start:2600 stop:3010 length:411 start_codon:yes stop_codon:yes gene_type:complete
MEKKIGWQKYEDIIEENISSPIMDSILNKLAEKASDDEDEGYKDSYSESEETEETHAMIPMSRQLVEDISMLTNFDCWMGHTNFDITPNIKNELDLIKGVELLKICSRYRFFIGVGKMFDFKDVRQRIEDTILTGD